MRGKLSKSIQMIEEKNEKQKELEIKLIEAERDIENLQTREKSKIEK